MKCILAGSFSCYFSLHRDERFALLFFTILKYSHEWQNMQLTRWREYPAHCILLTPAADFSLLCRADRAYLVITHYIHTLSRNLLLKKHTGPLLTLPLILILKITRNLPCQYSVFHIILQISTPYNMGETGKYSFTRNRFKKATLINTFQ